jgi:hypothetical protein
MITPLFPLSSLWIASRANGSLFANGGASMCLGLKHLHNQEMGAEPTPEWAKPAVLGRPAQAHFGPVRSPFAHMGPPVIMHFIPSICTILMMSSLRPRWRVFSHEVRSFTLQSSGMFLCNTSVLATFGSDLIKLSNTNGTPQLLFWTCCNSVLYVHVFLQKHNTSKCTYKDELVMSLVCLVEG